MRYAAINSGRAGLCLAIWLCGVLGSPALGKGLWREYDELVNPRTFQESTYHIRVPDVVDPSYRIPVVVILHDAGSNGADIVDDERLVKAFVDMGYAVLAPDALPRRNARIGFAGRKPIATGHGYSTITLPFSYSRKKFIVTDSDGTTRVMKWRTDLGWYFYNVDRVRYSLGDNVQSQPMYERLGRDEIQNLGNVLGHAAEVYGIDPNPVLIIGLGHGGSLVWQIACYAPELGQILAPVGGAFWRNIPTDCQSGANLVHTHHRASAFWPLGGTKGNKRRFARTSIDINLEMLLRKNGCGPDKQADRNDDLGVNHTTWADCLGARLIELMVLDDVFAFQTWWLDEMLGRIALTDTERAPEAPEETLETGPVVKAPGAETGFEAAGAETGFKTSGTETGFAAPGAATGFKRSGAGTGFKTTGAGTGFRTPGSGAGSSFKPAK